MATALIETRFAGTGLAANAQKSQVATQTLVWLMCVFHTKYAASPCLRSRTMLARCPMASRSWLLNSATPSSKESRRPARTLSLIAPSPLPAKRVSMSAVAMILRVGCGRST